MNKIVVLSLLFLFRLTGICWGFICGDPMLFPSPTTSRSGSNVWRRVLSFRANSNTNKDTIWFLRRATKNSAAFLTTKRTTTTTTAEQETAISDQSSSASKPTTIAVVGSGAVGCYYGARLWEQGHLVKFLFRGENYEAAKSHGLNVTSVYGDMFIGPKDVNAYEDTSAMGTVDWVIVALKSSSLQAIPELVAPLLDPDRTRVLVIMNGLIEEDLIRMMKEKFGQKDDGPLECCQTLYGGMALVCSNRIGPARVDHSYAGLLSAGVASSRSLDAAKDEEAFRALWTENEKVEIAYEESLLRGRWKKMVWNLPFNGISVAMGGITIDKVVNDPGLRELAYIVMDETIAAANADLEKMYGEGGYDPLGGTEKDTMMTLSDGMGPYKTSTMLDFLERRSMEVQYLFEKPVERARRLGVPTPHLETLTIQIAAFQRIYNLF